MNEKFYIKDIDLTSVVLYFILVIFGWFNLFAVSYSDKFTSVFNLNTTYGVQLIWILVAMILIILLFATDHRIFHFFSYPIYAFTVLLLLAVLVFGTEVNSSRSWFRLLGFNLQPAEFAKMGTAIAVARYLSGYNVKLWTWRAMTIVCALIGIPFLLIAAQPDFGTAMVFSAFMLLLYREGMPGWIMAVAFFCASLFLVTLLTSQLTVIIILVILAFIGTGIYLKRLINLVYALLVFTSAFFVAWLISRVLGKEIDTYYLLIIATAFSSLTLIIVAIRKRLKYVFPIVAMLTGSIIFTYTVDYVFDKVLQPHQQTRVNILLGKETDIRNVGYNLNQSKIAIGSGGFLGKGYLNGTQTKLDFVPEQSTDFIFCTIGEEWGFTGTTIVIAIYAILLIRLLFLAERQRSKFARIYGYAVISILFFHFGVNIAMTIGLFPVVGIPLPFFSYGGSSMLAFTTMLFIFIKLDSKRKSYAK
jgi:rod shape determining protein RodA